jgi:hypothetical protein
MLALSSYGKFLWLGGYGLRSILIHGVIEVRTGGPPETPEAAATGTLLAKITQNGSQFIAGERSGGALLIDHPLDDVLTHSGTWRLISSAAGTAGWWRFYGNYADDGGVDTGLIHVRMDGDVGPDSPLRLADSDITLGTNIPARFYLSLSNI